MIPWIKKVSLRSESLKTVGIYTFSNFLTKSISFASLPLFTYVLSKRDFGILTIFSSSISFLMPFISLAVLYSTSSDYFQMSKGKFASFITTTFPMPVIVTLISMCALYLSLPFLENNFSFVPIFVFLIPLVAYFNHLYEQAMVLIRNNNEPKKYLWLTASKASIDLGVAILLVMVFYLGWQGRMWGFVASGLVVSAYSIYYMVRKGYLSGSHDRSIIKHELIYSVPVIATQFSIFCLSASDRYFINYYYGEERTGVYSLAATFASILLILSTALMQFLLPKIYSQLGQLNSASEVLRLFKKYSLLIVGGAIAIALLSTIAYHTIIHPKFLEGLKYFYYLLIGNTIWCFAYFFYSFLIYYKAKRKFLVIAFSSVLVSLLLNYFFIKTFAEIGGAIANVCIYTIILLIVYLLAKKYIGQPASNPPR